MSIEETAREYIRLRRLKIDLKNHRNWMHTQCTSVAGDCCIFTPTQPDEWCAHCRESDVAHQWYLLAGRQAAAALRRLERATNR